MSRTLNDAPTQRLGQKTLLSDFYLISPTHFLSTTELKSFKLVFCSCRILRFTYKFQRNRLCNRIIGEYLNKKGGRPSGNVINKQPFNNQIAALPAKKNSGSGAIAMAIKRIYFGKGYNPLIPAIIPMPPPPPIKALPGRFRMAASNT